MKEKLIFEIECGLTTCTFDKGRSCLFFNNSVTLSATCGVFGKLFDKDGWIQRDEECRRMTTVNSF